MSLGGASELHCLLERRLALTEICFEECQKVVDCGAKSSRASEGRQVPVGDGPKPPVVPGSEALAECRCQLDRSIGHVQRFEDPLADQPLEVGALS